MDVHWLYWISSTYPLESVDNQHISTYVWWIFTGYSLDIQWITNAYPLILAEYTMDLQWISGCYRISSIQSIGFQTNPLDIHLNPRRYPPQLHKNASESPEIHQNLVTTTEFQVDIHKPLPVIHWNIQWISTAIQWFWLNFGGSREIQTRSCAIEVGTVVDTQWIRVDIHLNRKKLLPYMHHDMPKQRFTREPGFGPYPPLCVMVSTAYPLDWQQNPMDLHWKPLYNQYKSSGYRRKGRSIVAVLRQRGR